MIDISGDCICFRNVPVARISPQISIGLLRDFEDYLIGGQDAVFLKKELQEKEDEIEDLEEATEEAFVANAEKIKRELEGKINLVAHIKAGLFVKVEILEMIDEIILDNANE